MSQQTTSELTTRDVLLQVDRRLTLIEDDLRSLDEKLDSRIGALDNRLTGEIRALDNRLTGEIRALDSRMETHVATLRSEMNLGMAGLHRELNNRFYWLVGLLFVSWLSTMGTVLFKS